MTNGPLDVCILVHPFFDAVQNLNQEITFSPQEKRFQKLLLSLWGKIASQSAKNLSPFLVIVHPATASKVEIIKQNIQAFRTVGATNNAIRLEQLTTEYNRFMNYLKTHHAVFITRANPNQAISEWFRRLKPSRDINVKVFGEYEKICAKAVGEMGSATLRDLGLSGNVQVVKEWCRPHEPNKMVFYKGATYFKKYRSKHDRRMVQQRRKRAKLK